MPPTLLSTTYFGPIEWYHHLYRSPQCVIEQWESFQKQTYRNRCIIATASGLQTLSVPIVKEETKAAEKRDHAAIRQVRISNHGDWRRQHWNAIRSAYGESPFFDYYEDDLRPFFTTHWDHLLDFNEAIRTTICRLLDIEPNVRWSASFQATPADAVDLRTAINPKHPEDTGFTPKPYYQVYAHKHGFRPHLSILDLLLNMGPEAVFYL